MPATCAVENKILQHVFSLTLSKKIESLLNFGTGVGAILQENVSIDDSILLSEHSFLACLTNGNRFEESGLNPRIDQITLG
jgi:hypothetical protein